MHLRLARENDATAVREIYAPYIEMSAISFETEVPSIEEMVSRIVSTLPAYPWIVAEDSGQVLGYAYAHTFAPRSAYRWSVETSIYLRADATGRGYGTRLYGSLLALVPAQGYHQAFAGIALLNASSVALHESFGFVPVALYQDVGWKLGGWHDVQWWQRRLGNAQSGELREPRNLDGLDESTLRQLLG